MSKFMSPKRIKEYRDQSRAYDQFSPNGQLHIICPQCGALVVLFEKLKPSIRSHIVGLNKDRPIKAMKELRKATGCDLGVAKAAIYHLRNKQSQCCNCHSEMPKGALICSQCMSVNLDW